MNNINQILSGQLATLAIRLCQAEMVIDEFIKFTSKGTFDTIYAEVQKKVLSRHSDAIKALKNILVDLNPNMTDEQVLKLLVQLSSDRN